MRIPLRYFSLALLCLSLSLPAHSKWFKPSQWEGKVTRVSDGDTLWIETQISSSQNGMAKTKQTVTRKVRIEGIDAPEICQTYGKTAQAALQQKVLHKAVVVDTRSKDDYGRDIAKLKLNNEDIGAWLVSNGHAWSYHSRRNNGMYAKEEQTAQSEKRGLFANPNPTEPRQFRQQRGSCFVKYKPK